MESNTLNTILVIEDDPNIRNGIANFLKMENFKVLTAENGKVGVETARQNVPDLIISDIMMPILDGYGVLHEIRSDNNLTNIPILLLSAKSERQMIREGMNLGADDYLTKPFTFDELLKAIYIRIKRKEEIQSKSNEKLDKISSKILSLMPHEFYTPLTSILGFSELLITDFNNLNPEEMKDMFISIHSSGKRLQNLIENTLLYFWFTGSKEITSELPILLNEITTNPNDLIQEISNDESKLFNRTNDLSFKLTKISSIKIREDHYVKIIKELIINACKFSNQNSKIQIFTSIDEKHFSISIQDEGLGMDKEQINSISEFTQFNKDYYKQQGQGLGLFVIISLIKLYNGNFSLESEPSKGTKITISLLIDTI